MSAITPDIEATYRIVTPAFIGGADNNTTAELRLPSIKGLLRFWWRTLAWNRIGNNVTTLRQEEAELFGSSDEKIGQSKVIMRLKSSRSLTVQNTQASQRGTLKGAYYLGYGAMATTGEFSRPAIKSSQSFTVQARVKNGARRHQQELIDSFRLLGLVGGLGSRSRRGWGSLTLTELLLNGSERSLLSFKDELRDIARGYAIRAYDPDSPPEWTAWSQLSKLLLIQSTSAETNPLILLNLIGSELVQYRSYGRMKGNRRETLTGRDSELRFPDDHDLMRTQAPQTRERHPDRIAFGLPHNYGKRPSDMVNPTGPGNRRASPLFIHIHQAAESDKCEAVLAFLPAQFLPRSEKVDVGGIQVPVTRAITAGTAYKTERLWEPIFGFIDRFLGVDYEFKSGDVTTSDLSDKDYNDWLKTLNIAVEELL